MKRIEDGTVTYKNNKIVPSEIYTGRKLEKEIGDPRCWAVTSVDCINTAVNTIKGALESRT